MERKVEKQVKRSVKAGLSVTDIEVAIRKFAKAPEDAKVSLTYDPEFNDLLSGATIEYELVPRQRTPKE